MKENGIVGWRGYYLEESRFPGGVMLGVCEIKDDSMNS